MKTWIIVALVVLLIIFFGAPSCFILPYSHNHRNCKNNDFADDFDELIRAAVAEQQEADRILDRAIANYSQPADDKFAAEYVAHEMSPVFTPLPVNTAYQQIGAVPTWDDKKHIIYNLKDAKSACEEDEDCNYVVANLPVIYAMPGTYGIPVAGLKPGHSKNNKMFHLRSVLRKRPPPAL